jgi:hypothetical protein
MALTIGFIVVVNGAANVGIVSTKSKPLLQMNVTCFQPLFLFHVLPLAEYCLFVQPNPCHSGYLWQHDRRLGKLVEPLLFSDISGDCGITFRQ